MRHMEGGWPENVDGAEADQVDRFLKKATKVCDCEAERQRDWSDCVSTGGMGRWRLTIVGVCGGGDGAGEQVQGCGTKLRRHCGDEFEAKRDHGCV